MLRGGGGSQQVLGYFLNGGGAQKVSTPLTDGGLRKVYPVLKGLAQNFSDLPFYHFVAHPLSEINEQSLS